MKLPVIRQAYLVASIINLAGVILSVVADPRRMILSVVVGCGLLIAGVTGRCGMEKLLSLMPWNKSKVS